VLPLRPWSRLRQAARHTLAVLVQILEGKLMCQKSDDVTLIDTINEYVLVQKKVLWEVPLLRAVIGPPVFTAGGDQTSHGAGQLPLGSTAELTVHLYASRLLFFMIADPRVKVIMDSLCNLRNNPANRVDLVHSQLEGEGMVHSSVVEDLELRPDYTPVFSSTCRSDAADFTLGGLLKSCENLGYKEAPQPTGITFELKQ
jgi:hypothetical protein